jgi:hypothetical protein
MANYGASWLNEKTGEIHTPRSRMAYPTLLEAKGIKDKPDSKPKFSVTLLIPKAADISVLKAALVEALVGKFGKDWQKKKLLMPLLKTVDQERLAEYADDYPLILRASANADYKPFIYGPDAKQFNGQPSDIYAGRWAVVAGKFYAYDNVSKGASFGLNRIQLLEHDEPVAGGRVATSEGFEQVNIGSGTADDVFGDAPKQGAGKKTELDDEIPF